MSQTYESLNALVPVESLLADASKALDDTRRTLRDIEIPEILGAVGGVGAGAIAGWRILAVSAAVGTAGGAALTSGLATAGAVVGGGMVAGLGVVAAPAVALSLAGYWLLSRRNRSLLDRKKTALFQEALQKRDVLARELQSQNAANEERVTYLTHLLAALQRVVDDLNLDLTREPQE